MTARNTKSKGARRSDCPIANVLDVVGDKWTFLVIRDLRLGKRTYGELLDSPEGIPTNILADRLKRLEESGIIESKPYQERPPRYAYTLTKKGEELGEVLRGVRAAHSLDLDRVLALWQLQIADAVVVLDHERARALHAGAGARR